ncbi:hypothetical protein [Flavobacterium sp.]|uniref:hypothetical protein n=1 Tax=Flavobacterium sp. TaxID=239 RepID=UPI003D266698
MQLLKKTLPVFSYIYHPIFISIYGTLFYFLVSPSYEFIPLNRVYLILIQVAILTLLLPLSLYFLFVSLGIISSFTEASIKERRVPITIQAFLLFFLLKFSVSLEELPELYYFFLGGFLSSVMALICVLMKFKASLHMIGISSLATFIFGLATLFELPLVNSVALSIVCVGLVASSRLYMKSHTNLELLVGLLIGIFSQVVLWYFWL